MSTSTEVHAMSSLHGEQSLAAAAIENRALHLDRDPIRAASPANSLHHRHIHHDNESITTHDLQNDPYSLSRALKSPSELSLIKRSTRESSNNPNTPKKRSKHQKKPSAKEIQKFYENQNEKIQKLLKSVEEHRTCAQETQADTAVKYKIAVTGSFIANVALSGLQMFAAIKSGSLSLFTTMADSVFDPLSNVTLILAHRAINRVDSKKFPSGKARLETVGNIVFASLMCSVSMILIAFSARDLAAGAGGEDTKAFHLESVIAVGVAFTVKLCLFFYCWAIKDIYSDVEILWQDHRNDLFINGFGILTSVGGSKLRWWIDPLGSMVLSILIISLWGTTAWGEYMLLVGEAADPEMQQLVTYISMTHSPEILQLDTVRAYHSGPRLIIEVDVVMDPEATLRHTHDVAEALQMKLESLPDVERAYVHIDYETDHRPEHFIKKEL